MAANGPGGWRSDDADGVTRVMEIGMAFCGAKTLFAAVELGVFAALQDGPLTAVQLDERLGLPGRGTRDFLHALVGLDVLAQQDGRFALTALAERHLVPDAPGYLGGFLARADRVLYQAWGGLASALRTGEPHVGVQRPGGSVFESLYRSPEAMRDFLAMMDAINGPLGPELARVFPWSRYRSVVDVGGARGNVAAQLVRAHPHLDACVFDLPEVEPAFHERMAELGAAGRIRFVGGDFFIDPLPEADVLILGHVLEDWPDEQRQLIVKSAHDAVRPGGVLLVYDPMLDGDAGGLVPIFTSLTMLLMTAGGSEYTSDECRGWLRTAGFGDTWAHRLGNGGDVLVGGYRVGDG
jgi:O-methyltransferase domain/Dimerisation domain